MDGQPSPSRYQFLQVGDGLSFLFLSISQEILLQWYLKHFCRYSELFVYQSLKIVVKWVLIPDSIGLGWHLQICISHSAWVMLMILMLLVLLVGGPQFQKWVSRFSSSHHQPIPPVLTWYVSILLARPLLGSWWRETVIQWDAYQSLMELHLELEEQGKR